MGRPAVRVGIALSVLFAGGAAWWLSGAQESERSTGDLTVSAGAAAVTSMPVSLETPGVHEIEPLIEVGGQWAMPAQQAPVQQAAATVPPVIDAESQTETDAESETETSVPVEAAAASAESYTWHDGDRALEVRLQPDVVLLDGDVVSRDDWAEVGGNAENAAAQSEDSAAGTGEVLPLYRSDEGGLMALPGGVVLVLDPDWDDAAVASFLGRNGIAADRTTALDYVTNGFFVETEPGLASLDLANSLVAQSGVELSSPNWWLETVTD